MPYSTQGSLELLTYPPLANFFTPPWCYLTVLDSSSSHHAKLYFTLLHSLFHFTWHYIIYIPWICFTLLDSTSFSTSFYLILIKFILTRFYFILLDSPSCNHGSTSLYHGSTSITLLWLFNFTWHYFITMDLPDSTSFYHALLVHLYFILPRLYFTILDSTSFYHTLFDSASIYHCCTSLYLTLLQSIILDSTWLWVTNGSTSLWSTWLTFIQPWLYFTVP